LPLANQIYLTEIKKEYEGDVFFPVFENDFQEVSRDVTEEMDFVVYKRK
jgi:dihydrofolate reductase